MDSRLKPRRAPRYDFRRENCEEKMPKLQPGWTWVHGPDCLPSNPVGRCVGSHSLNNPEGRRASSKEYREKTGFCEICEHAVKAHPECKACGIWSGANHAAESLYAYMEYQLCDSCISAWKNMDKQRGREATRGEFNRTKLKMFTHKGGGKLYG